MKQDEKNKLYTLLKENFQAFSRSLMTLGHTDMVEPEIHFTTNYPIKALPFPISHALQEKTKKQIDEMTEAGIIEKIIATWACPLLF